jgi:hypothetical protein
MTSISMRIVAVVGSLLLTAAPQAKLHAGNPDRIGEAGAAELLINPWARSSGWYGINIASVTGVESMRLNVAGLAFTEGTEVAFSRNLWLQGSDISINVLGLAQRLGEGALGIEVMTMNLGEIPVTTANAPEGTGATFRPTIANFAISYSRKFADYLAGGITFRGISHSITDASAFGMAMDVGIQYVTGNDMHPERVKFGIALRNVGTPMRFSGDGLGFRVNPPSGNYTIAADQQTSDFELPSLLTIAGSYDFFIGSSSRITAVAQFQSNSFYKDQFGVGFEYGFAVKGEERFQLRAGYRYEDGLFDVATRTNAHTGLAAGFSFNQPFKTDGPGFGIDYSYRSSNPYNGTHAIGLRFRL